MYVSRTINLLQNTEALREACTLLEKQLIEYESLQVTYETCQTASAANAEKLIKDLAKTKEEVQKARSLANEEKSLKLLTETKLKRLTEDLEVMKKERDSFKEQCAEFKTYSAGLLEELTLADEKLSDCQVNLKSYERQFTDLMMENNMLKEDSTLQFTHLSNVKESNYQLGQQIAELKV